MDPILEIIRLETSERWGTFGVLRINKKVTCFTLEPPNKDNRMGGSCIPAGQYYCRRFTGMKFHNTFLIENVPGRKWIVFHPGNVKDDTLGCVLLGDRIGELRGNRAVLKSKKAFEKFMKAMEGHSNAHLTIYWRC